MDRAITSTTLLYSACLAASPRAARERERRISGATGPPRCLYSDLARWLKGCGRQRCQQEELERRECRRTVKKLSLARSRSDRRERCVHEFSELRVRARCAALGDTRALREPQIANFICGELAGAAFSTRDRAHGDSSDAAVVRPRLSPLSTLATALRTSLPARTAPEHPHQPCTRRSPPPPLWRSSPSPRPTQRAPRPPSSPTATTSSRARSRARSGGRRRARSRPAGARGRSSLCAGRGPATPRAPSPRSLERSRARSPC